MAGLANVSHFTHALGFFATIALFDSDGMISMQLDDYALSGAEPVSVAI